MADRNVDCRVILRQRDRRSVYDRETEHRYQDQQSRTDPIFEGESFQRNQVRSRIRFDGRGPGGGAGARSEADSAVPNGDVTATFGSSPSWRAAINSMS